MFGKEYRNHLDILTQSFGQMNKEYEAKVKKNNRGTPILIWIKKAYIRLFGIPEIGFQIRSLYFKKILDRYVNKKLLYILDAGSGIGAYTIWLGKKFSDAHVFGGDSDKYKIQSTTALARELLLPNVTFYYLDITKTQLKANYDLILCIDVLEHIHNYELVIKKFSKHLRLGGYLFIHVPQPNQKRIFSLFKKWSHEDHIHEGIGKSVLENILKKIGLKVIASKETFGFFGRFSWEINHFMLSKNFVLTGLTYPLLYFLAKIDLLLNNEKGLGVAILAKKV